MPVYNVGTTVVSETIPVTITEYTSNVIGPNSHGVPENFPLIPADASCHKCHGTGYKKKLITRHWKCCKKCAKKYGTDVKAIDLKHLSTSTHAAPVYTTTTMY